MKNRLIKYKKYFSTGLWHVHTNYTDGENTVDEYCQFAVKNKIPLIAFTEHVRKKLSYDFDKYLEDIKKARKKYPGLIILAGCEAKVIDLEGNLDVNEEVLKKCDLVLGAFHSFPYNDKESYLIALKNMLNNGRVDIWAHPTLLAQKKGFKLTNKEIENIVKTCQEGNVLIEINQRYNLPNERFKEIAKKADNKFIHSCDAHKIQS